MISPIRIGLVQNSKWNWKEGQGHGLLHKDEIEVNNEVRERNRA